MLVLCTTKIWLKYLIVSPQIEANNILTPLLHFSPSAPNPDMYSMEGAEEAPKLFCFQTNHQKTPPAGQEMLPILSYL